MLRIGPDIERRMQNWRLWRLLAIYDGRINHRSPFPAYNLAPPGPRRGEAQYPILAGEAEDTDRFVKGMSFEHRQALEVYWLRLAWSMRNKARACRCRERELERRVEEAHELVARYFAKSTRARISVEFRHSGVSGSEETPTTPRGDG